MVVLTNASYSVSNHLIGHLKFTELYVKYILMKMENNRRNNWSSGKWLMQGCRQSLDR